ncbi:MAG: oligoendopeptidase F [Pseudomonadota bacterium]
MSTRTVPQRKDIPAAHQWDLTPLFDSDAQWETLFDQVTSDLEGYAAYRGRLGESPALLREAIAYDLDVSLNLSRLYTFAHLRSDEDKANTRALGFYQRAASLYTRAAECSSFYRPELMAIPAPRMAAFLDSADLAPYRFHLETILRYAPHTLTGTEEALLAKSGEMSQAAAQVFGQLDNVDLQFGTITTADGSQSELSHGNFITFLMDPDRDIRKCAFRQYYAQYDAHRHTLAAALAASAKKDVFYARARNYTDCRSAALFPDNMPSSVYDNLVTTVRENRAPLFDYLALRRKALNLEALHIYDTYVPLVADVDFIMPFEEAVDVCVQALAPLGTVYGDTLRQGLLGGWVDRYENRGKRSGAYSSGCYGSPPYILMNYEDHAINSLYTLIHEAGHSMHTYLSNQAQPHVYHGYAIFVAEVASTLNETLLSHYLLDRHANDPRMRAYILNREIDNIRATLYRQTMFAEFEQRVHAAAESDQPLTVDTFQNIYRELLETYFGAHLILDPELTLECFRIPHFYTAFYVYKYATGISAAISLARGILEGGSKKTDEYLEFLSLGGSRYPLDALAVAGVDMTSPQPITAAIAHFSLRLAQLTETL